MSVPEIFAFIYGSSKQETQNTFFDFEINVMLTDTKH